MSNSTYLDLRQGSSLTLKDGIFKVSGSTLIPFLTKTDAGGTNSLGKFFYGGTPPTSTGSILNYDGTLFVGGIIVANPVMWNKSFTVINPPSDAILGQVNSAGAIAIKGVCNSSSGFAGTFSAGNNSNCVLFSQNGVTTSTVYPAHLIQIARQSSGTGSMSGDIINIDDSPTVSGSISGSILKSVTATVLKLDLKPRVTDTVGNTAYYFDTVSSLNSAYRAQFLNNGSNPIKFWADGSVDLPSAGKFRINGVPISGGSGSSFSLTDGIFDAKTSTLAPYNTTTIGAFDSGNTSPSSVASRINYNGVFYASKFIVDTTGKTSVCGGQLSIDITGNTKMKFNPSVTSSSTAVSYSFDTTNNLTDSNAKIASFKNHGIEKAYIQQAGGIYCVGEFRVTADGTTYGRLLNNSLEIVIGGTTKSSFNPATTESAGNVAYKFDTSNTLTSAYRAQFLNNGSNPIKFWADGSVDLPSAGKFRINGIPISGGSTTLTNGILKASSTTFNPYGTQASGKFDTGTTAPAHNTRLNYDGALYTYSLTSTDVMTASNFVLSSDRRLKTNIESIIPKKLDVDYVKFNFKDKENRDRYGVIAQDIEKIDPNLVYTDDNGLKAVSYIDLLIKEIVYLKSEVESLKKQINDKN